MKTERSHLFDNAKLILMLLVVLGHAFEVTGLESSPVYKLVYLFHMPAFALVAGFFSKRLKPAAILTLVWQYALFQTLYCLFSAFILQRPVPLVQALTTPYWIMWFLFSLIFCKLMAPLLLHLKAHPLLMVELFILLSLLSDLVRDINYPFSLSRILQFFPFFLLGAYADFSHFEKLRRIPKWVAAAGFGLSFLALAGVSRFSHWMLYGTLPFARLRLAPDDGIFLQLSLILWGFVLIGCFFILIPQGESLFSRMGRRTLPCYLLHGFVMRGLDTAGFGEGLSPAGQILFYLASLGLALLLMSAQVAAAMRPILQPAWLAGKRRRAPVRL